MIDYSLDFTKVVYIVGRKYNEWTKQVKNSNW